MNEHLTALRREMMRLSCALQQANFIALMRAFADAILTDQ
uniref:Uncharacterized protein n=1 Tax=Nonomuraea gerenzanensis TaxID=93944 RepID=A0A1M4EMD3_9ACTN|nr:hypothetical protein BN4615_P9513 [Nonomuraea gerenzanensis]